MSYVTIPAPTSPKRSGYLNKTSKSILLWYLPPHYTPQQNSIEILWHEIKCAITSGYFEDRFEQIKASISHMLANDQGVYSKDVPIHA